VFLLKFLAIDTECTVWDRELAQNHTMMAYQLFCRHKAAGEQNRAAQMIELLACRSHHGRGRSTLTVRGRFGASLLYDTLSQVEQMQNQNQDQDAQDTTITASTQDRGMDTAVPAATVSGPDLGQEASILGNHTEHMPQQQQAEQGSSIPWGMWDQSLWNSLQFGENGDLSMSLDDLLQ
jgi:hypothetical protein